MATFRKELDGFNSVGAGRRANLRLDVGNDNGGPTYSAIYLELKHDPGAAPGTLMTQALMPTHIDEINLVVSRKVGNGSNQRKRISIIDNMLPADMQSIYADLGFPLIDGYFPIFFRRPEFSIEELEEDHFELGTMDVVSAVLEVKFNTGVTDPEIVAFAELRAGPPRPMGQVITYASETYEAQAAAGTRRLKHLDVIGMKGLKALHVTTDAIDDYEVEINNNPYRDPIPPALDEYIDDLAAFNTGGRVPQAGWTHIDFAGNRYSEILDMTVVNSFALDLSFNAANPEFRVIREEVQGERMKPKAK